MKDAFAAEAGQFEALFAYWLRLRGDHGGVPPRSALNPVTIKDLLPYVCLIERRSRDDLFIRLSGTAIDAISPQPMTGSNYADLCTPETRNFVTDAATLICQHPCGHRFKRSVTFSNGKSHELTSIALPMTDREGRMSYILGMTSARADHLATSTPPPSEYISVRFLASEFVDIGYGLPADLTLP